MYPSSVNAATLRMLLINSITPSAVCRPLCHRKVKYSTHLGGTRGFPYRAWRGFDMRGYRRGPPGDPVVGFVDPTSSKIYDIANLAWWRKATNKERRTISYPTAIQPGEYEYRPIDRTPLLDGPPYRDFRPNDTLTTTTIARSTITRGRFVLQSTSLGHPIIHDGAIPSK